MIETSYNIEKGGRVILLYISFRCHTYLCTYFKYTIVETNFDVTSTDQCIHLSYLEDQRNLKIYNITIHVLNHVFAGFSPLQRLGVGMFLAGTAFVITALLQIAIDVSIINYYNYCDYCIVF